VKAALPWLVNNLALPSKLYLLANSENSIYYQAVQRRYIPNVFYTRIVGTNIKNRLREARITPAAAGSVALVATLYDGEFDPVVTKAITATVASNTTPTTAFSLLAIGDSMTFEGYWLNKVVSAIPTISTAGIRKGANITTVNHEGRSGWTLDNYFTRTGNFGFSGFTPFMHPIGVYRYLGTTKAWLDIAATPTNPDIIGMTAIYATLAPDVNGKPTKDPGSGALAANAVIYNNSAAQYELWNGSTWSVVTGLTWEFNFAKYLSTFGVTAPTAVCMFLGTNDFGSLAPRLVAATFATFKTHLDTAIASVFAAGITKFGLMLPLSITGSMEQDTGTQFTRMKDAAMWEARNLMITNYDNRTGEGIYLIDAGSAVDPDWGLNFAAAEKPFSDYAGVETVLPTTNAPHPSVAGYNQIGTRVAAWIQAVR
jgi:lysophospholipase L1-like esterase